MTDRQLANRLFDLECLSRSIRKRLGFIEDLSGPHRDPAGAIKLRNEITVDLAEFRNAASRLAMPTVAQTVRVQPEGDTEDSIETLALQNALEDVAEETAHNDPYIQAWAKVEPVTPQAVSNNIKPLLEAMGIRDDATASGGAA